MLLLLSLNVHVFLLDVLKLPRKVVLPDIPKLISVLKWILVKLHIVLKSLFQKVCLLRKIQHGQTWTNGWESRSREVRTLCKAVRLNIGKVCAWVQTNFWTLSWPLCHPFLWQLFVVLLFWFAYSCPLPIVLFLLRNIKNAWNAKLFLYLMQKFSLVFFLSLSLSQVIYCKLFIATKRPIVRSFVSHSQLEEP